MWLILRHWIKARKVYWIIQIVTLLKNFNCLFREEFFFIVIICGLSLEFFLSKILFTLRHNNQNYSLFIILIILSAHTSFLALHQLVILILLCLRRFWYITLSLHILLTYAVQLFLVLECSISPLNDALNLYDPFKYVYNLRFVAIYGIYIYGELNPWPNVYEAHVVSLGQ